MLNAALMKGTAIMLVRAYKEASGAEVARLLGREPWVMTWKGRSAFGSALLPADVVLLPALARSSSASRAGVLDFSLRGGLAT